MQDLVQLLQQVLANQGAILNKLDLLTNITLSQGARLNMTIDDLEKQVAANITVEGSSLQLVNGLIAVVQAHAGDDARMQKLLADLKASAGPLAAAVAANTPAAPATPPAATPPAATAPTS